MANDENNDYSEFSHLMQEDDIVVYYEPVVIEEVDAFEIHDEVQVMDNHGLYYNYLEGKHFISLQVKFMRNELIFHSL